MGGLFSGSVRKEGIGPGEVNGRPVQHSWTKLDVRLSKPGVQSLGPDGRLKSAQTERIGDWASWMAVKVSQALKLA